MANIISGREEVDSSAEPPTFVQMSNGLTSVVIAVLAMATAAEATTPSQRMLAGAIASRDQSFLGGGVAGFSLCKLPWDRSTFEEDRDFLVRACARAAAGQDWSLLDYEPRHDWTTDRLVGIAALLEALEPTDVVDPPEWLWRLMCEVPVEMCETHHVFLHREGCVVCNDG